MARKIVTTILVVFTLGVLVAQMPQCFRHCWYENGQRRCAVVCS